MQESFPPEVLSVAFSFNPQDRDLIDEVAVAITVALGRAANRSVALRHILSVYRNLPEATRRAAIEQEQRR